MNHRILRLLLRGSLDAKGSAAQSVVFGILLGLSTCQFAFYVV